jgi:uncharacterized protein with FMN-binding domain
VSAESNSNANRDSVSRLAESSNRGQWLKSHLVGISSAAVIAVYAAGFERTRAAAARFSNEDAVRRSAPPLRTTGEIGALVPRLPEAAPAPAAEPSVPSAKPPTQATEPAGKPVSKTTPKSSTPPAPVEARAADSVTAPVAPVVAPAPARDSAPAPAPAKPVETPVKAAQAAAQPDTAQAEKPARKDGTYTGWGTSRHGDIQATVQIKDGKIVFASITECLTRYSCSWIAALPPQVLARQSADVDFVSGATESTNAFYYAVVEALNKAK